LSGESHDDRTDRGTLHDHERAAVLTGAFEQCELASSTVRMSRM
jgi:hypothetical protein